jgi:tetratricopeptide (TPR) repeat protein
MRLGVDADANEVEANFREALLTAQASRDDIEAAKAAAGLSYVLIYRQGKMKEGEFFDQLATALLDRSGPGNERLRSWVILTQAAAAERKGDFETARAWAKASVALREKAMGPEHPEVAIGLNGLAFMSQLCGRNDEALAAANRAIDIFLKHGDPEGFELAITYSTKGDALNALGRYAEAERAFESSLRIFRDQVDPMHPEIAYPTHGLGETRLRQGRPAEAIPLLQRALHICDPDRCDPPLVKDTRAALARAFAANRGR